MYAILADIIYLVCSLFTILKVGRVLYRNGEIYLFGECPDKAISHSSNNFLYLCYCLLNTGFAFFFLGTAGEIKSAGAMLEFITRTQGSIYLSLGTLHVINVLFAPPIMKYYLQKKLLTNKNQES